MNDNNQDNKLQRKTNSKGMVAVVLALLPIVLLLVSWVLEPFVGWVFVFLYILSVGIPIFITSVVLGFLGLRSDNNKTPAIISLVINAIILAIRIVNL